MTIFRFEIFNPHTNNTKEKSKTLAEINDAPKLCVKVVSRLDGVTPQHPVVCFYHH